MNPNAEENQIEQTGCLFFEAGNVTQIPRCSFVPFLYIQYIYFNYMKIKAFSFKDKLLGVTCVTVRGAFVLAAILWEISLERAGPYLTGVGSALSMQPLSFDRY